MNKTPNYQLNQWEAEDKVLRADFNADNARIDAALDRKGNCRIISGTYTGSGTFGVNAPNTLTFPFKPAAVILSGYNGTAVLLAGAEACTSAIGTMYAQWKLTWSGNTLSWYVFEVRTPSTLSNNSAYTQLNESDRVYRYILIGATDG